MSKIGRVAQRCILYIQLYLITHYCYSSQSNNELLSILNTVEYTKILLFCFWIASKNNEKILTINNNLLINRLKSNKNLTKWQNQITYKCPIE